MKRATVMLFCFAAASAQALPAQAQASQGNRGKVADRCPASEHFDPVMRMCTPNAKPSEPPLSHSAEKPGNPTSALPKRTARPSPEPVMNMPMPGASSSNEGAMVRINQFMVYSNTSGPRGLSRLTGPGMWMLMFDKDLSPGNHLSVDMMGTLEHLTVGDRGTPQLLQTENVDAMHPHDYIMALEFRDSLTLDAATNERLTVLFAPRGEAAVGPVPFMHRDTAQGNPDAPLGHALQDGFHDVSTVVGIEYQFARTTIEATAFSGRAVVWPLPLHSPDSWAVRVNQQLDEHLSIGASYADAFLPQDTAGAVHNQFVAAWLSASYLIGHNTLKSSLVWGRGRAAQEAPLNSFLEEAVYQQGRNKFYNRAEVLQITPAQLDLAGAQDAAIPKWAGALTLGYERTVFENAGLSLFAGGSYTKDFIPRAFEAAYGSDPGGEKVYLRIAFHGKIP